MELNSTSSVWGNDQSEVCTFGGESHAAPKPINDRPAASGSMSSQLADLPTREDSAEQGLRERARKCYVKNRHYHGTTEDGKERIRAHGLDVSQKSEGATSAAAFHALWTKKHDDGKVKPASQYNYLSTSRAAHVFATLASMGPNNPGPPAVVRIIGARLVAPSLEQDSDAAPKSAELPYNPNWRTADKIPAAHVLNSKKKEPTKDSKEIFRTVLDADGVKVSEDVAGQLLADVQSDSEKEDFTEEHIANYKSFWRGKFKK